MKKILPFIFMSVFACQATATVLTFDDIPSGSIENDVGGMPDYQGFNFSFTLNWIDVQDSAWNFGAYSGDYALLNNYGGAGIIRRDNGATFTFDGLWAKQWATTANSAGANGLFGVLEGYKNGALAWSINTGLNGSYQYFGAQAGTIDELKLDFGNHFLVDNIALNQPAAVSAPGTLALLTLALAGLGVRRSKKTAS